jgi:hypothetical protein
LSTPPSAAKALPFLHSHPLDFVECILKVKVQIFHVMGKAWITNPPHKDYPN